MTSNSEFVLGNLSLLAIHVQEKDMGKHAFSGTQQVAKRAFCCCS